ncbi:MAG TPA: hypothetical protein PKA06_08355, partial [Gemmatales bacterium]|nr:hypothetical protein [Gemmatales bacterium]
VVPLSRLKGGKRRMLRLCEVVGPREGRYVVRDLFRYQQQGVRDGKAYGSYFATGKRPKCFSRLRAAGLHLPEEMFNKRILATNSEFDQATWKHRFQMETSIKETL